MAWGQSKIRGTRAAGWRRLALDPLGGPPRWARAWDRASAAPQLSEQGQGAVSCEMQKARGVTAAADAALAEPLGPRCARGRQPSGPQCQVRRAAHILEDKLPSLSRIDSNFFKREREPADSMNQPLPRERVAAPARNIHLQKQFIPLSGALGKCPRRVPSEARGAGAGEGVGTTAPHPHPAPHAPLSSAPARPEPPGWPMRLRRPGPRGGSLRRGLPRRGRGAQGPGGGGDKCQGRRPGARLRRPGAAPSARRWYSPLGAPPPATLPARCRRCRRRDHRLLAAPPHPPPPLPAPGQPQSPELLRPRFGPRRRQQTSFSGLPAPPPGPKLCSQSQGAPL